MKKRRFAILFGLFVAAVVTMTAVSSSAAARPAPSVRSHPAVWTNTSGVQKSIPVAASKRINALVKEAMRHAQAGTNTVWCPGATATPRNDPPAGDTPRTQKCVFLSGSAGACVQYSTDPNALQVCKFRQTGTTRNFAIVLQIIVQRSSFSTLDNPGADQQRGQQIAKVVQTAATKSNWSFANQILKQSVGRGANDSDNEAFDHTMAETRGELQGALPNFTPLIGKLQSSEPLTEGDETASPTTPGPAVSQIQNSQQTVKVCQGSGDDCHTPGVANNLSSVYQSLRQRERAVNAVTIDQQQNPDDGSCVAEDPPDDLLATRNMCAFVEQHTAAPGKNVSGAAELYRQFQSGANTGELTQLQDPHVFSNGIDHDIHQVSDVLNTIFTYQSARQVQRAKHATIVHQFQDPRTAKGFGSSQIGTAADTWFGRQFATQIQTTDGQFSIPVSSRGQEQLLTYDGDSPGTFDVIIRGVQNDHSDEQHCTGPGDCHIAIQCRGTYAPEGISLGSCGPFSDLSRGFLRRR